MKAQLAFWSLFFLSGGAHLWSAEPVESTTRIFKDREGQPLATQDDREILAFLKDAEITSSEPISDGITKPFRVEMKGANLSGRAIFRYGETKGKKAVIDGELHLNFHDSAGFEVAAYQMSEMMGLHKVPPATIREHLGRPGSVQLWIEKAKTRKQQILDREIDPNEVDQRLEEHQMKAFDFLIYNFDRHPGNVLVDSEGFTWWIDHTRSFKPETKVPFLKQVNHIGATFFARLQEVSDKEIRTAMKPYLSDLQLGALLKRRRKLVRHFKNLIKKYGEATVIALP
ncbi:hypothetical protein [Acanthopleuribacter pedis]|uniref:PI3K/PI4K catalytic domain-containing protein n=1 Tax=Acanthopleuribacter pedis TaxID=442870 RepID=A0A8J7U8M4_9BACT|nr:hypothetical protein [Acanthopleuribacter pedis]MBO1322716.1 hypothetical protein [Acanthopleuribacter pedis]